MASTARTLAWLAVGVVTLVPGVATIRADFSFALHRSVGSGAKLDLGTCATGIFLSILAFGQGDLVDL